MITQQKSNSIGPFLVLTFIYFIVGFLTTVNGQCQGPLKMAFLDHAEGLKNTFTTLISFFFFLLFRKFLSFAYPVLLLLYITGK